MESRKKGQRKRKSGGVGNIFEVCDDDLSPESEEVESEEPKAKVLKTRNSDVSESRQNNVESNLKKENEHVKKIKKILEKTDEEPNGSTLNTKLEDCKYVSLKHVCETVNPLLEVKNLNDEALEDGELNDINPMLDETENETLSDIKSLQPLITIKFDNKMVADIYQNDFIRFINSFIELEVQNPDDTTINVFKNICIDPKEWVVVDASNTPGVFSKIGKDIEPEEVLAQELPVTPKNESSKKKKKKKKQKELFVVDTKPSVDNEKSIKTKYSTKFLLNDEKQEEPGEKDKPPSQSMCFNCGKDHSLKDCAQPKNYVKINANRQKFMTKNKTSRYHLEEEQKFSHLQPGKISPALRKALGLKKHQVPSYIYQMRRLGYPPGWLEEAKVVDSELAMFDIDGNNVKNTNLNKIKGLDPEKVINYPGFNIPLEKEFKDEYKYHRVPPYSSDFSKDKMIDFFKKQYLREEDDFETQDMDLDNTNDLIVIDDTEEVMDIKEIQNKQLDSLIDSDSNNVPSPSLNDLEKQKDSLLAELKKPEEPVPWEYSTESNSSCNKEEQKELGEEAKEEQSQNTKCAVKKGKNGSNIDGSDSDVEIVAETVCKAVETIDSDVQIVTENINETVGTLKTNVKIVTNTEKVSESVETSNVEVITNTVNKSLETNSEIEISESDDSKNSSSLLVNTNLNSVKHSTYGTPIIKSSSPYHRLPNPDNFSVGVSPVIDFENLPNSTGKYEQMTGVLQKVREALKNKPKSKT